MLLVHINYFQEKTPHFESSPDLLPNTEKITLSCWWSNFWLNYQPLFKPLKKGGWSKKYSPIHQQLSSHFCFMKIFLNENDVTVQKSLSPETASHLLVRHDVVALQWSWVSAEQASSRPVVLTEDCPVDIVEAIAGNQAVPACCTRETLKKNK